MDECEPLVELRSGRVWAPACRSNRSFSTTSANSWSSSPFSVTQKLTSVVCAAISGL